MLQHLGLVLAFFGSLILVRGALANDKELASSTKATADMKVLPTYQSAIAARYDAAWGASFLAVGFLCQVVAGAAASPGFVSALAIGTGAAGAWWVLRRRSVQGQERSFLASRRRG